MNEGLADSFYKNSSYLIMKKVDKNNYRAKKIRENNMQSLRWNNTANTALRNQISVKLLVAVKKREVALSIK